MRGSILLVMGISMRIISFGQTPAKGENLKIIWPEELHWKVGANQEDNTMQLMELVPGNESIDKWTLMGTMLSLKNMELTAMEPAVDLFGKSALKESPKAILTVIETNNTAQHKWVLFKIESLRLANDPDPESELYYIIQGEHTLYVNCIAIKAHSLSDDFIKKWTRVFKGSTFVYE